MKVVIIGSGNVATVLGKKIVAAGHEIVQVVGRNVEDVMKLASLFKAEHANNLLEIIDFGDLYLVAVSDRVVSEVAGELKLNNQIVVHTAAAVSKDVLKGSSTNYGVLYPLQTLRKENLSLPVIPILVDANNGDTMVTLKEFATGWADTVSFAGDEQRLKFHLAAVFANNFTNHLLALANNICSINGLDYNLLHPIVKETIARANEKSPPLVQTGPAIRNDLATVDKHRILLKDAPELLKVYNVLTDSIMRFSLTNTR